jgi:hypothetical protein
MSKKQSNIKIKSRKLKPAEPETDEEIIEFGSEDLSDASDASDCSYYEEEPEPMPAKPTRPTNVKSQTRRDNVSQMSSSSKASSKASSRALSRVGKAPSRSTAPSRVSKRGGSHDKKKESDTERLSRRSARAAADAEYTAALKAHADTIKAKTDALHKDYNLKQSKAIETAELRKMLMSKLVL